jgi:hypothetical protein
MPTPMFPLYGTSVAGEPVVDATATELEAALDSCDELRDAMSRTPRVSPEMDPTPATPGPGAPERTFDNELRPPMPMPPGMR